MTFSFKEFGIILVLVTVSLIVFNISKKYILNKIKIKKSYILISLLIIIALPFVFYKTFYKIQAIYYVQTIVLSILILTYMEIRRNEKAQANRPVIGRPKSKKKNS